MKIRQIRNVSSIGLFLSSIVFAVSAFAAPAAPTVTATVYSLTAAEIFWNRVEADPAVVEYAVYSGEELVVTTDGISYFSDELAPDQTYLVTVIAIDANGERSEPSNIVTINTSGGSESANPPTTPDGIEGQVYSDSAVEIFWGRSTDNVAVVGYEIYRNDEFLIELDALSFFEDSLTSGVEYTYYVVAVDNEGNRSSPSEAITLTPLGSGDSTETLLAPETVEAFAYSTTTIEIIWSRSSSTSSSGIFYELYRDGIFVSRMDALSYLDSELDPGTEYVYTVVTVNGDGDVSPSSQAVRIATLGDGDDNEFDITDESQFREVLQQGWLGPCDVFEDASGSFQYVNLFTEDLYIFDFYTYSSLDCTGVPFGYLFPLAVQQYSLGDVIALADGTLVWEYDAVSVQQGLDPDPAADPWSDEAGVENFDIIGLIEGVPHFGATYGATPEERPTELQAFAADTVRANRGNPDFSESDLIGGEWASYCRGLDVGGTRQFRSVFTEGAELVIEEYWASDDCSGESYAIIESNLTRSYGEVFQSVYGDYMLATNWERVDSVVTKYDDSAGLPEPGVRETGASTFEFDALALEENDVLLTAYCVIANSGVCEKSEDARADMIDFNWPERYTRSE